jgi:ribosomal-protein-alanine N-acetyltransferase
VKILPETGETEIGYRLLPKYWGRGLATEGARAMVDYSLRNLRVDKVVGVASPENLASRRVLEKAGLEFRKYDRFYQVQCAYYSLEHR